MTTFIGVRNGSLIPKEYWNNKNEINWETYCWYTCKWTIITDVLPTDFVSLADKESLEEVKNYISSHLSKYKDTITFIYSEGNLSFSTIRRIK